MCGANAIAEEGELGRGWQSQLITPDQEIFRVSTRKVLTGNIFILDIRKQIDGLMSFVIHDFYGHIYVFI